MTPSRPDTRVAAGPASRAAAHGEGGPTRSNGEHQQAFESALAAAQADEPASVPDGTRGEGADAVQSHAGADPSNIATATAAPVEDPCSLPTTASWLLIALAGGPVLRPDDEQVADQSAASGAAVADAAGGVPVVMPSESPGMSNAPGSTSDAVGDAPSAERAAASGWPVGEWTTAAAGAASQATAIGTPTPSAIAEPTSDEALAAAAEADVLPADAVPRIGRDSSAVVAVTTEASILGEPADVRETPATPPPRTLPAGPDDAGSIRVAADAMHARSDRDEGKPLRRDPQMGVVAAAARVDVAPPAADVAPLKRAVEIVERLAPSAPHGGRPRDPGTGISAGADAHAAPVQPAWPGLEVRGGADVQAAEAAGAPRALAGQVVTQIVSSLKMQWKDGIGEARLHLRPDALGTVSVALRVEQGAVIAVVRAESPQVQDWVLQHQQSLREQMQAAGLRLDELTVSPDDRGRHGQPDAQPQQRRRPRRPYEGDDTPRFELLA